MFFFFLFFFLCNEANVILDGKEQRYATVLILEAGDKDDSLDVTDVANWATVSLVFHHSTSL